MSEQHEIQISGLTLSMSVGIDKMSRDRNQILKARHCNSGYEVTMILRGDCMLDVSDQHYTLHAGQAVIIAPGRYHTLRSVPGEFDHFTFRMSLPKSTLARSMQQQIPDHYVFSITHQITQLCLELFNVYAAKAAYWQDMYSALLKVLALNVLKLLHLGDAPRRSTPYKQVKSAHRRSTNTLTTISPRTRALTIWPGR